MQTLSTENIFIYDRTFVLTFVWYRHLACCWAFSAVAAVEGLIRIKIGYQMHLSEQQLVDCARNGNHGCSGGWMANAFEYIVQN